MEDSARSQQLVAFRNMVKSSEHFAEKTAQFLKTNL